MTSRITPPQQMAIRRLRAAGFVLDGDDIWTPVLDVAFNTTAEVHLFPLSHGTGLLLELDISFTPPLQFQAFGLQAPWLSGGGRWCRYDPGARAYCFRAPGRVLTIAAADVLNHRIGPSWKIQGSLLQGYLLAELNDALDPSQSYRGAMLSITDSTGLVHRFSVGPLRFGQLPLERSPAPSPPSTTSETVPITKPVSVFSATIDRLLAETEGKGKR